VIDQRLPSRGSLDLLLAAALAEIERADVDYQRRQWLVYHALELSSLIGYPTGIGMDDKEPDWPVVYIELPTGQVSWHMPPHPVPYDGHTTREKYSRCRLFSESVNSSV
jgi:hypothetical protein